MKRIAKCHCGKLNVETEGEPEQIFMCYCEDCQRRTGTSFNLGAWFSHKEISTTGETQTYERTGNSGSTVSFYFCPFCGSNVYWKCPDLFSGLTAVAVGCFADPTFPAPTASVYGKNRPHWLTQPTGIPSFTAGSRSEQE